MSNMYAFSKKQWNVFVGCEHDCVYCKDSFQRQAKRQKQNCLDCYSFKPHCHEKRLTASVPATAKNEFIFVAASGDICFCPDDFFQKIIARIASEKNKTFLLQSKNPSTFARIAKPIPANLLLGITLESNRDYPGISKAPSQRQRISDFAKIVHSRKMITIEPILDFDLDEFVKIIKTLNPVLVWIGYETKRRCKLPEPEPAKTMLLINRVREFVEVQEKWIK